MQGSFSLVAKLRTMNMLQVGGNRGKTPSILIIYGLFDDAANS
jgi:hypothetical protein